MTQADKALERVIHDITLALQVCPDPRIAKLLDRAKRYREMRIVESDLNKSCEAVANAAAGQVTTHRMGG